MAFAGMKVCLNTRN